MFPLDASSIDKSLPVPVGTQLHGLLNYVLTFRNIPYGTKLPSVRQLAADLGIAPMTVAQVYQQLRDAGFIEMRHGLGAFTATDPSKANSDALPVSILRADIEVMLGKAEQLGISTIQLAAMISAQAQLRKPRSGLSIVFIGIFEGPARDYVEQIRPVLSAADQIRILTLDTLTVSQEARQICLDADLVLTFVHREAEVRGLVGAANILALRFIPSEQTRQALAGLDPRARVAAVTYFQEYIAIMRPSVREFAPHVSDIKVTWAAAPDLAQVITNCDAVIFASGADHIADLVPPGVRCFEYRHAPDPGAMQNVLVPHLADLRRDRIAGTDATPTAMTGDTTA